MKCSNILLWQSRLFRRIVPFYACITLLIDGCFFWCKWQGYYYKKHPYC